MGYVSEKVYFSTSLVEVRENTLHYHWHCCQKFCGCTVARVIRATAVRMDLAAKTPWKLCATLRVWAALTDAEPWAPVSGVTHPLSKGQQVDRALALNTAGRCKERGSKMGRRKGGSFRDLNKW